MSNNIVSSLKLAYEAVEDEWWFFTDELRLSVSTILNNYASLQKQLVVARDEAAKAKKIPNKEMVEYKKKLVEQTKTIDDYTTKVQELQSSIGGLNLFIDDNNVKIFELTADLEETSKELEKHKQFVEDLKRNNSATVELLQLERKESFENISKLGESLGQKTEECEKWRKAAAEYEAVKSVLANFYASMNRVLNREEKLSELSEEVVNVNNHRE